MFISEASNAGPASEPDVLRLLAEALADPACGWACGGFGAVAEFTRDAGEPAVAGPGLSCVTPRGGVSIEPHPAMRLLAYEMPAGKIGWRNAIELCLPTQGLDGPAREVVTELGPDIGALREQDRDGVLFDMGLGLPNVAFCVRATGEAVPAMRALRGLALSGGDSGFAALPRLSPHRVCVGPLGRVEVFAPIPPPSGRSPDGPHTHLLPRLLAHRLTHAANLPVPENLVPCLSMFPASPLCGGTDPMLFDSVRFERFGPVLAAYAPPGWLAAKRAGFAGLPPDPSAGRHASLAARVGARQAAFLHERSAAGATR